MLADLRVVPSYHFFLGVRLYSMRYFIPLKSLLATVPATSSMPLIPALATVGSTAGDGQDEDLFVLK
jgi:hypothetical protein